MKKALASLAFLALWAPTHALGASWAVGASPGGMAQLRAQLPGATTLVPGRSLLVHGARPHVHGATYVVEVGKPRRHVAFDNLEPDAGQQWYLPQVSAWNFWASPPTLAQVKVAVIDSGIDGTHPEFRGRIAAGVSYVGGSWHTDNCGHGTFVAGEIAANPFNNIGIAGLAFNAKLLVAKVVDTNCNVSTSGEIRAITWAVNHGARVINLSIGGIRDPLDPELDSYSPPEADAVEYAYSKGVLVVAAVGNGTQTPRTPWPYADYPAALPHVIGVAAVREGGAVPDYSNRDKQFADLAAPGGPIFSTIPRNMIDASITGCAGMAYSNCGTSEFRDGIGTSFAAPQVSAAAALLLGVDPKLAPDQLAWLLERSAIDADTGSGCSKCPAGRDSLTGWGNLNITAALNLLGNGNHLPMADVLEPNDNAGTAARRLWGPFPRTLRATLDYWDDPIDVYEIKLAKGADLFARIGRGAASDPTLALWRPGTEHVGSLAEPGDRAARSAAVGGQERLSYHASEAGIYYLSVKAEVPSFEPGRYDLSVAITNKT